MAKKQLDLSFLKPQFEEIDLPSRGKYYKGIPHLETGKLHIRAMTSVEEKLLDRFNANTFYTTVDEIISKCIKEDIDVDKLTLGDRIFILLKIRVMSYGSTYEVRYSCPECEAEYPITIDLSKFEIVYVNEDIEEPYEFPLPVSGATVKMRLPRSGDVRESTDRSFAERKKNGVFIDASVYQKAMCCEEFIFPESSQDAGYVVKPQEDFKLLVGIMQRLHVNDTREIERFFNDHDHGFTEPIMMNCKVCNASFEQYLALNWDFFRPRNRRREDTDLQQFDDDVSYWESNGISGKRATRSGPVRKLSMVGDPDIDVRSEKKVPEENI